MMEQYYDIKPNYGGDIVNNSKLTTEQWSMVFDCVSLRMSQLEDTKILYSSEPQEFIQKKIDTLKEILHKIGPLSV